MHTQYTRMGSSFLGNGLQGCGLRYGPPVLVSSGVLMSTKWCDPFGQFQLYVSHTNLISGDAVRKTEQCGFHTGGVRGWSCCLLLVCPSSGSHLRVQIFSVIANLFYY